MGLIALAPVLGMIALVGQLRRRDHRPPSSLSARLFLVTATTSWTSYLFLGQPHGTVHFTIALGLAAGAFAMLHELARRHRLHAHGRVWRALDVIAFQLCLAVLLMEGSLRLLASSQPAELLGRPSDPVAIRVERNRLRPGSRRFGFPVNHHGHYDVDFAPAGFDRRLVVSIGDSFSAGVVPHAFHFTTVAERQLPGVEVANLGFPALGPAEYLHLLDTEGLPLEPDVVVINLFLGNDFLTPRRNGAGGPARPRRDSLLLRAMGALARLLDHWLDRDEVLWLAALSRLVRIAMAVEPGVGVDPTSSADQAQLSERYPWLADPHLERPTFRRESFLAMELSRMQRLSTESSEDLRPVIEILRQIRHRVGETPLLFMLIPSEPEVHDGLWQEIRQRADGPLRRNRIHQWLLGALEDERLHYLDLLPTLRAQPEDADGNRHLYHLRDTHFNARGNRVAGEALADELRPLLAPPTGVSPRRP